MHPFILRLCAPFALWAWLPLIGALLPSGACATVGTDSTFLLVDGKRVFVIGSYDIPPGLTPRDLRQAGFNLYFEFLRSWNPVRVPGLRQVANLGSSLLAAPTQVPWLMETASELGRDPDLFVWHGPDEPAWQDDPMDPDQLKQGREIVRQYDGSGAPHPVWINHACRGTRAHPDSFEVLRPYLECADVFSMDIYPVPPSREHSILADKTIACVGEHTDILIDLLSRDGRRLKPAWMVLQGFSWTDFFFWHEWYGALQSVYDFRRIRQATAGDVNGDGLQDLVFLYSDTGSPGDAVRLDVERSSGTDFLLPETWMETEAETLSVWEVYGCGCGDVTGDGMADAVLWTYDEHGGALRVAASLGDSFGGLRTGFETALPILDPANVRGFGVGDVDGDGLADGVFASLADTSGSRRPGLWVLRSPGSSSDRPELWLETHSPETSLEHLIEFRTGDFDGNARDDVCLLLDDGETLDLRVALSLGSTFAPATSWWDTSSVEFPAEDFHGFTVQDLNGDGMDDLLILYSQEDDPINPQWLVVLLCQGGRFSLERWGVSAIGDIQFCNGIFTLGGDFNGDGFGDFAMLYDRRFPDGDPYHVVRVGLSYGEKFGEPGPSHAESRFMAYDAVIHGASGLVWWGLFYTGGPYSVWQGIAEVAGELRTLSPLLVCEGLGDSLSVSPSPVEVLPKRVGRDACLIAANRADSTVDAVFTASWLEEFDTFEVLWEDRSVSCRADSLEDRFGPYDVHVYLARLATEEEPAEGPFSARPNPFGTTTCLRVCADGPVPIDIYDVRGRRVRRLVAGPDGAGFSCVDWDGSDESGRAVASGVYICRFKTGNRFSSRKIVCVR